MNLWFAISLTIAVISLYLFVIEAFSVAFKLTGLATKKIKFQVASLFTGSGFTTNESEIIVNDDRRRKIAITCMYTGHVFSVVIMGLLINVLISLGTSIKNSVDIFSNPLEWYFIVFYVSVFIFLMVLVIKIPPVNKRFQLFLERIAVKLSKRNRNNNIITVLDVYGKNAIIEVILNKIPPFANEIPLYQMQLTKKYSINILSIRRGVRTIEVNKDTMFKKGDIIVIFGLINDIKEAFIDSFDDAASTIVVNNVNSISLLNNYGGNALVEVDISEVPKELEGVPMKDSHLSDRYNTSVVVVKRNNEYIYANKDLIIEKGDVVTMIGPYQNIKHLFKNDAK